MRTRSTSAIDALNGAVGAAHWVGVWSVAQHFPRLAMELATRARCSRSHRSAVARLTPTVWIVPNGASPLPELGTLWSDRRHTDVAGQALPGGRRIGSEGMLCGRDVCAGQKRRAWLGKPSGARAPKSWVLQTAMVFLSPYGQKVLRQLK